MFKYLYIDNSKRFIQDNKLNFLFLYLFIGFVCVMINFMNNTIWAAANYITIFMFFFVLQIDMLIDDH